MEEECIYCGKDCKCREFILWLNTYNLYDIKADLDGFMEKKSIKLYYGGFIPTIKNATVPAIVFEEFDEDNSNEEFKVMKPVDYINLTKIQADKIKKFIENENLT